MKGGEDDSLTSAQCHDGSSLEITWSNISSIRQLLSRGSNKKFTSADVIERNFESPLLGIIREDGTECWKLERAWSLCLGKEEVGNGAGFRNISDGAMTGVKG